MRKKRDVDLLKTRLDVYSDEWRTAQPDPITKVKMPTNLTPTGKVRKPRLKKNNVASANSQGNPDTDAKPLIDGKLSKRKRSKSDKVGSIIHIFSIFTFLRSSINLSIFSRTKIQTHPNDRPIHSSSFAKNNAPF